jgi:hypothetical protein
VTYLIEYLGEFKFIFKTVLGYVSGDQMGPFEAKKMKSKISCLGTFKVQFASCEHTVYAHVCLKSNRRLPLINCRPRKTHFRFPYIYSKYKYTHTFILWICLYIYIYCLLSLWRVVRGSKLMHLDLTHGLFIT